MPSNFMHQPFANPRTGTKKFCKRFDARLALVALHSDRITNRARASRASSIFLRRIVGVVFMRVKSTCAHQVRPPLKPVLMNQIYVEPTRSVTNRRRAADQDKDSAEGR